MLKHLADIIALFLLFEIDHRADSYLQSVKFSAAIVVLRKRLLVTASETMLNASRVPASYSSHQPSIQRKLASTERL